MGSSVANLASTIVGMVQLGDSKMEFTNQNDYLSHGNCVNCELVEPHV